MKTTAERYKQMQCLRRIYSPSAFAFQRFCLSIPRRTFHLYDQTHCFYRLPTAAQGFPATSYCTGSIRSPNPFKEARPPSPARAQENFCRVPPGTGRKNIGIDPQFPHFSVDRFGYIVRRKRERQLFHSLFFRTASSFYSIKFII